MTHAAIGRQAYDAFAIGGNGLRRGVSHGAFGIPAAAPIAGQPAQGREANAGSPPFPRRALLLDWRREVAVMPRIPWTLLTPAGWLMILSAGVSVILVTLAWKLLR